MKLQEITRAAAAATLDFTAIPATLQESAEKAHGFRRGMNRRPSRASARRLLRDIPFDRVAGHVACRRTEVGARPQARHPLQGRELLTQDARSVSLQAEHDLIRGQCWRCGHKKVDVIGHHLQGQDRAIKRDHSIRQQGPQAVRDRANEYLSSPNRNPHEMVVYQRHRGTLMSIRCIHQRQYSIFKRTAPDVPGRCSPGCSGASQAVALV